MSPRMSDERPDDDGLRAAVARKGSFWGTMRAVAWSFLGIRRRVTNGSGHLTTEALLGETTEEPKESGPIF